MSNAQLKTVVENLSGMAEKLEAAKREAAEKMKLELTPLFSALLDAVPQVKSVTWAQYTPYFNDFGERVFSLNDPEFANDTNEDFETYREDGDLGDGVWAYSDSIRRAEEFTAEQKEAIALFTEVFFKLDDVMKTSFGDHVVVRFANGEFETQEYEHD
jgi:hypothetical protein